MSSTRDSRFGESRRQIEAEHRLQTSRKVDERPRLFRNFMETTGSKESRCVFPVASWKVYVIPYDDLTQYRSCSCCPQKALLFLRFCCGIPSPSQVPPKLKNLQRERGPGKSTVGLKQKTTPVRGDGQRNPCPRGLGRRSFNGQVCLCVGWFVFGLLLSLAKCQMKFAVCSGLTHEWHACPPPLSHSYKNQMLNPRTPPTRGPSLGKAMRCVPWNRKENVLNTYGIVSKRRNGRK